LGITNTSAINSPLKSNKLGYLKRNAWNLNSTAILSIGQGKVLSDKVVAEKVLILVIEPDHGLNPSLLLLLLLIFIYEYCTTDELFTKYVRLWKTFRDSKEQITTNRE
jgi:hypothetical protein